MGLINRTPTDHDKDEQGFIEQDIQRIEDRKLRNALIIEYMEIRHC